jgi:regulator of RNase E activity RraA
MRNGLVCNAGGIWKVGTPVFVTGISSLNPHKDGPGEINFPISCGDFPVHPGGIIVGDGAGVVVVARGNAPVVFLELKKECVEENKMKA